MKHAFLKLICLLLTLNSYSQTLDSTTIALPCFLFPGVTDLATTTPVDSASQYCWELVFPTSLNSVIFNGQIGPMCTAIPEVQITSVLPAQMMIFCVTATSSCCSSNTSCDTVFASPPLNFPPGNSPVALPGTSGIYSVLQDCFSNNMSYNYTVTGDITINGAGSSLTTGQDTVTLNFGSNFTGGTLCVYTVNSFGLSSPTICMTINLPVSIDEPGKTKNKIIFDAINNKLIINDLTGDLKIFSGNGKLAREILNASDEIYLNELPTGFYIAVFTNKYTVHSLKFSHIRPTNR